MSGIDSSGISRRRALGLAGIAAGAAALGTTAAAPASAATAWRYLGVVTANIGRDNLAAREPAIEAVRNSLSLSGDEDRPLVGWQEIGEGDPDTREKGWIDQYFSIMYRNLHLADAGHRVPISAPKAYNVVSQRVTSVHGGKEGVSPNRVISEAVLAAANDTALRFAFLNTHFVAGAWNGKEDPYEAWRDEMWELHFQKMRTVMEGYRAQGLPIIWTGDCNRNPMPKFYPLKEIRAFSTGIDQIGWIPGTNGVEIRLSSTKTVPMNVDGHDARVALLQLRRV